MMSRPLIPPPGRAPDAWGVSAGEGVDVSTGEGGTWGVGEGGPCSVKLAHGLGGTLAHSLWTLGLSPANGLIALVNAPLPSVTTDVATWLEVSQKRVMLSFLRKSWPVTVMGVLAPPAVGDSPIVAPLGSGAYMVAAAPVVGLELVALTENV
jgi:hypothetical protein